ncbi:TetR/AcrR family transcriptional regulator [Streptomyces sp. NPDC087659]|uniref:TetR/AcrR family transcriptional regulator n=1 Tax=Streptomyces sp. NPDC087659 TaxID=3365801 RepID=UPI00381972E4
MSSSTSPTVRAIRPSAARERLLTTAARLFYAEGIHTVGVDRVIAEAKVTRATFYRHFPGKEDLVVAYLEMRDHEIRAAAGGIDHVNAPARDKAVLLLHGVGDELCKTGFRGCPFINAAAEYPDPEHPAHQVVTTHRAWFHATLVSLLEEADHPDPYFGAATLVMLRDGAMVAGNLESAEQARLALIRAGKAFLGLGAAPSGA